MNEIVMDSLVEVTLSKPDDFLKVKETLTRIGISSKKEKKLIQSCHIFHRRGRYYITHFKEMFALDGKEVDFDENDLARRNTIVSLLEQWGLIKIVDSKRVLMKVEVNQIKIIPFKEKSEWILETKYQIGQKH